MTPPLFLRTLAVYFSIHLIALVAPSQLHAALTTFSFSGTVSNVSFDTGTPSEFSAGSTFSGSYTFDTLDTDSNASPNNGYYLSSITSLEFLVGTFSGSFSTGNILVRDNVPVQDIYQVESYSPGTIPPVLGLDLESFTLSLNDASGSVFVTDTQQLTPPNINDFSSTSIRLTLVDATFSNFGEVTATVDSLAVVPEPSSLGLLLLGGAVSLCARRKHRQRG